MSPTPQQLLSSSPSTTYQSEASKQNESRGSSSVSLGIQPGLISQQQQQPGVSPIAASQLASAFQYTNLNPGITPIPLVPVAGIGGIQLVPQVSSLAAFTNYSYIRSLLEHSRTRTFVEPQRFLDSSGFAPKIILEFDTRPEGEHNHPSWHFTRAPVSR